MRKALRKQSLEQAMKYRQNGFSLIELLIVVAIILIIAAIAIPNFLASKMAANESAAVQESRAIATAEVAYQTVYTIGYAANLTDLGDAGGQTSSSTNACLIDSALASGQKGGYFYVYTPLVQDADGDYTTYSLNANPMTHGVTGRRYFYTDQSAAIHYNYTAVATAADAAL
jgi:type IV pilus assembly protein PilA